MPDITGSGAVAPEGSIEGCAEKVAPDHVRSFVPVPGHRVQEANNSASGVDPGSVPGWDSKALAFKDANVFHSAGWAAVLLETYGWKPFYIATEGAILPLIEASSWVTGTKGIALPFSDLCSPLGDRDAVQRAVETAVALGRRRGWKYVEFRGGLQLIPHAVCSASYYAHEVALEPDSQAVYSRFDSSVKRAIRKAEREGVSVEFSVDDRGLMDFWRLHQLTRRKHGVPPQPFRFMLKIQEHLLRTGAGVIAVARREGRALAACMFLRFGDTVVYKFGASDDSMQEFRASNAAFWEAMKHYAKLGCKTLHMGRTDIGHEGLRRFKLGWGARESMLQYCRFDFSSNTFQAEQSKGSCGFSKRLFRALPLPVLRLMGGLLYPHAA